MLLTQSEIKIPGHPEFVVRPVTMDDLAAAVELLRVEQIEEHGKASLTAEELHVDWTAPGFNMAESTRAVFTPSGRMIAYQEVWDLREIPVRPIVSGYTLPEYRGRGLGTALLQWAEQRCHQVFAKVPEDARVVMEANINANNESARQLLEAAGLTYGEAG